MTEEEKPKFTDNPEVTNLSFDRVFCHIHSEPFTSQWPRGYPAWITLGFEEWSDSEDFHISCLVGNEEATKEEKARIIEDALDGMPMCCRMGRDSIMKVWKKIANLGGGPWKKAFCKSCKAFSLGTPYRHTDPKTKKYTVLKHLCMWCALTKIKPLKDEK